MYFIINLGMMTCVDDAVGNMTAAFERKGILNNTLIIFSTGEQSKNRSGPPMIIVSSVTFFPQTLHTKINDWPAMDGWLVDQLPLAKCLGGTPVKDKWRWMTLDPR